jgi:hypothetical protein
MAAVRRDLRANDRHAGPCDCVQALAAEADPEQSLPRATSIVPLVMFLSVTAEQHARNGPGIGAVYSGRRGLKAVTLDCVTGSTCSGEVLRGVSCPSTRFCAAVGDQGTLLTTAIGGTTWTSQVAAGGSSTKQLTGVSCLRPTDCVAVGQGGTLLRMS